MHRQPPLSNDLSGKGKVYKTAFSAADKCEGDIATALGCFNCAGVEMQFDVCLHDRMTKTYFQKGKFV
jgi:hypothetical protein